MDPKSETIPVSVSSAQNTSNYAGVGYRFLAYWVDVILLRLVAYFLHLLPFNNTLLNQRFDLIDLLISVVGIVYFLYFWATSGQTLGSKLVAVRVISENGGKLGWSGAIIRGVVFIISLIPLALGCFWAIWDSKKQTWHDKAVKAFVVKTGDKNRVWLAILVVVLSILIPTLIDIANDFIAF